MSRTTDNMVLTSQLKNADSGGQFEAVKSQLRTGRCQITLTPRTRYDCDNIYAYHVLYISMAVCIIDNIPKPNILMYWRKTPFWSVRLQYI